jgi:putative protease
VNNAPGTTPRRPELLAPAGNEAMMRAAVENGADAVYFGLSDFNARLRADNFAADQLPRLMAGLHERGVRGYVTLNTLVFPSELGETADLLRACSRAGVDAVLVQDLGLALLASHLVPDLPVHASTQMTLTCAESILGAEALGLRFERVIAPRELSLRELARLRAALPDRDIEVFVHGALCVAYSGQCLTSEALGGRSANRGVCAQACRLPYDLIVDGQFRDTGDVKYLLSPRDLAAYEDLHRLVETGIASIKIEGRLKSPEYVAATMQTYRAALDQVFADGTGAPVAPVMTPDDRRKLEMTFSRGFTGGYLHAIDHQAVVEGRYPKKRGTYLGRVVRTAREGITVALEAPLRAGDGVVFDAGRPDLDEEGGRVYQMVLGRKVVKEINVAPGATPVEATLTFGSGQIRTRRVRPGDRVWKTSDPRLDADLAASFAPGRIHHRRPVRALVEGSPGQPLRLTLTDTDGCSVTVTDTLPADAATHRPLTREILLDQLGRLGNTPVILASLEARLKDDVMVPFSRLNDLRRRAVEALLETRRARGTQRREQPHALEMLRATLIPKANGCEPTPVPAPPRLSVLCRSLAQVEAVAALPGVHTIYTDFENPNHHRTARALIAPGGPRFAPATLRIMKPGEAPLAAKLLDAQPDAILVRSLAAWQVLRQSAPNTEFIGDYALNVANDLTAGLLRRHGLRLLTPSYDLNIDQLLDLLAHAPADWFEVVIHQHMPMFHMEHCVFCRFLSTGTDHTNCGRPCDTHHLALRDRMGFAHPVKADAGCRNTVFNAVAQSASEYLDRLLAAGVRRFRIEFLDEDPDAVRRAVEAYSAVLRGERDGRALWRELRAASKLGVTRGSLDHD